MNKIILAGLALTGSLIFCSPSFSCERVQVGGGPYNIDGKYRDWGNPPFISPKEYQTDIHISSLNMGIHHGIQEEAYDECGTRGINRNLHDAIMISYEYALYDDDFEPEEIVINLQYLNDSGRLYPASYERATYLTATIDAGSGKMHATGDIYKQKSYSEDDAEYIEILFKQNGVPDYTPAVITIAIKGKNGEQIKNIYNQANNVLSKKLSIFGQEYSLSFSVVGSVGPIAKGFQLSTDFEDMSISVVDGITGGSLASFQGEAAVWATGDLGAVASGVSFGSSVETPVGSVGVVSNNTGSIKGISTGFGPAIGIPLSLSRFYSQELGTTAVTTPSREDLDRDRSELDEDRDRGSIDERNDAFSGGGRNDHDGGSDHGSNPHGYDVTETDLNSGTTTEFDMPDPGDISDID